MYSMFLLAEATKITNQTIFMCGALLVAGILAGILLFKEDKSIKLKREDMLKAANILRNEGLEVIPNLLQCYAIGDLIGLEHGIRREMHRLSDTEHLEKEFQKVFDKLCIKKVEKSETRLPFLKHIIELANHQLQHSDFKFVLSKQGPTTVPPPASTAAGSASGAVSGSALSPV